MKPFFVKSLNFTKRDTIIFYLIVIIHLIFIYNENEIFLKLSTHIYAIKRTFQWE